VPSASKCGGQGGCTGNYRPEVVPSRLSNITLYLQALAVPARRNVNDAEVKRGEQLFSQANCSACHVPELRTGGNIAIPAAADLTIHAYTDLLHDGRARNVTEAILWHGGEAAQSREAFRALSKTDREALVKFVNSI